MNTHLLPDCAFKLGDGVRVVSFAHAGWNSRMVTSSSLAAGPTPPRTDAMPASDSLVLGSTWPQALSTSIRERLDR